MPVIKTSHTSETELLSGIMELYNESRPVDLDPCYSKGRIWKVLNLQPKFRSDVCPQVPGVARCDCRSLPYKPESIGSILFDPPFLPTGKSRSGLMAARFSGFDNLKDLYAMYDSSLIEFERVLRPGGLILWKCQDLITRNRQELIHVWIINRATELGFVVMDIFVLTKQAQLISSKWKNQVHARKNHCFYIVLSKGQSRH